MNQSTTDRTSRSSIQPQLEQSVAKLRLFHLRGLPCALRLLFRILAVADHGVDAIAITGQSRAGLPDAAFAPIRRSVICGEELQGRSVVRENPAVIVAVIVMQVIMRAEGEVEDAILQQKPWAVEVEFWAECDFRSAGERGFDLGRRNPVLPRQKIERIELLLENRRFMAALYGLGDDIKRAALAFARDHGRAGDPDFAAEI